MPAVITCPECEKRFKGKPGLGGKRIKCPSCGHGFQVPEDEEDGPAPAKKKAAEKPKAAAAPAPHAPASSNPFADDEDGPNKYEATELDLAPRCPNCTKELETGAIICLFCGYNTQTRQLGQTVKTIEKTGGQHFLHLLPGLLTAMVMVMVVIFNLHFCFVYPTLFDKESWLLVFAHESVKFWVALLSLGFIWAIGIFAFKRLLIEPKPAEDIKE